MSDACKVPVSHEKVLHYETFLNEVLKRELERINKERDLVFEELSDILQLRNTLQVLQDTSIFSSGRSFRTQVSKHDYTHSADCDRMMHNYSSFHGGYIFLSLCQLFEVHEIPAFNRIIN